jgi:hypothetical protein
MFYRYLIMNKCYEYVILQISKYRIFSKNADTKQWTFRKTMLINMQKN